MSATVSLRAWQQRALERFAASAAPDFLAVATPGAGKTTFALAAARFELGGEPGRRLVVVAPTQHLKTQWADAAAALGLVLATDWSTASGKLPRDVHGIVTTYQQVAASAGALREQVRDAFVILDEIHHAGEDRAWGDGLRRAFEPTRRRLALSGTPFRSDTAPIPFVSYHLDEARADFEYLYGDALVDGGVVRPVFFPRVNGHMEWSAPDGSIHSHTFDDALTAERANQRLRTALSSDGEWLPTVLGDANRRLMELRERHPDAAGLVIAADQDHAREVGRMLRDRFGTHATVVLSDDPGASARIAQFVHGRDPWIVAVRMVSEGVDIPRLRIGVYATVTTTELFFRQAVGRLVRWTGTADESAFLFIPDDPRLRSHAAHIAEGRRHSLARRDAERPEAPPAALDDLGRGADEEQLSLFAAISAVAIDDEVPVTSVFSDRFEERWGAVAPSHHQVEVSVAPPPPLPGAAAGLIDVRALRRKRQELRDKNSNRAGELVRATGRSHAEVNAELNRLAGITRVTEATVEQLDRRLKAADRWLRSG